MSLIYALSASSSVCFLCFFQAEDGIRDLVRSRGLGDVYKRQVDGSFTASTGATNGPLNESIVDMALQPDGKILVGGWFLSLIHI